jgi:hypothetical protein
MVQIDLVEQSQLILCPYLRVVFIFTLQLFKKYIGISIHLIYKNYHLINLEYLHILNTYRYMKLDVLNK